MCFLAAANGFCFALICAVYPTELLRSTQFCIQLAFKAPLCITLTISDQKIMSGSLFLSPKKLFPIKKKKYFFIQQLFIDATT